MFINLERRGNTICSRFGYADDLSLRPEVLVPPLVLAPGTTAELTQVRLPTSLTVQLLSSTSLTQSGLDFLTDIFAKHDLDEDQALSPQV